MRVPIPKFIIRYYKFDTMASHQKLGLNLEVKLKSVLKIVIWFIQWIDENTKKLKNQKLKCWVFTNNSLILVKLFKKKPKY